jgi:hypothetical protein
MSFTPVEKAVLRWFATHTADSNLQAQIAAAVPGKREETPIGFFTQLVLPSDFDVAGAPADGSQIALQGCALLAPELDPCATCLLHIEGGRVASLEVYAVADGHPLRVSTFRVEGEEDNYVDLRQ